MPENSDPVVSYMEDTQVGSSFGGNDEMYSKHKLAGGRRRRTRRGKSGKRKGNMGNMRKKMKLSRKKNTKSRRRH